MIKFNFLYNSKKNSYIQFVRVFLFYSKTESIHLYFKPKNTFIDFECVFFRYRVLELHQVKMKFNY